VIAQDAASAGLLPFPSSFFLSPLLPCFRGFLYVVWPQREHRWHPRRSAAPFPVEPLFFFISRPSEFFTSMDDYWKFHPYSAEATFLLPCLLLPLAFTFPQVFFRWILSLKGHSGFRGDSFLRTSSPCPLHALRGPRD